MKHLLKSSLLLIVITPLLFSCTDKKLVNSFIYYKVADGCEDMGKIVGEIRQAPLIGDSTTEVTATPYQGYTFIEWSDGLKDATRTDVAGSEQAITYIAFFEATNE